MSENGLEWLPEISLYFCNKILIIFAIILTIIATTMLTKMWKKKQQIPKIAENNPNPSKSAALPLCMDILLDTIEFFTAAQCEAVLLRAPNRTLCERLERRMAHFWWTEREAIAAQDLRISRRNAELCFRADFKKWLAFEDTNAKLLLVYAIQWRIVEAVEVPGIGQGDAIFVRAEWEEMDMNGMDLPWARKIGRWIAKTFKHLESAHRVLVRRILIESRKVFFADKCVWRVMPMSITFKCYNEAGKKRYHQGSGDPRWIMQNYCKSKWQPHLQCACPAMPIRDQFTIDVKRKPRVWKKLMYEWKTTPPHPDDWVRCPFKNSDPFQLDVPRRSFANYYGQDITARLHAGHLDVDRADSKKFEYSFYSICNSPVNCNVKAVQNGIQVRVNRNVPARMPMPRDGGIYRHPLNGEWAGKIDFTFGFERFLPLVPTALLGIQCNAQFVQVSDTYDLFGETKDEFKVISS